MKTKAQQAREMKAAHPRMSSTQIGEALCMDPRDVRRAIKRKQTKTWATRIANLARQEQAA